MKTRHKIIVGIAIVMVLALFVKIKPFYDSPANHIEDLKRIPEVAAFYQKYGHHDVTVFPDGVYNYQVGFQATNEENNWIMLRINYVYGIPFSATVFCTPDGIESQYRITDDVLEYLKEQNCFENS